MEGQDPVTPDQSTTAAHSGTTAPESDTMRYAVIDSPVDELTVVADGDVLVGVYFRGRMAAQLTGSDLPQLDAQDDPLFRATRDQLGAYFAGTLTAFDLPLEARGSRFQQDVWRLLQAIPYGATTTYGAIAEQVGGKGLSQRVGQTVGANPISIIIPCHRVIGADGSLTGFGGGLDRKRRLLALEEPVEVREARLF